MKKLILIFFTAVTIQSCSITKPRYIDIEREVITYKDSTILNVRDSIVWTPKEYFRDYTSLLDTLSIKGSNTEAKAWVDTTNHILAGSLLKEPEIAKESHIRYVDRIVERTDTLVRTETKEVPVEVIKYKRDKLFWWLLSYAGITISILIIYILKKFNII